MSVSLRRKSWFALTAVALCLAGYCAPPAFAAPSATKLSADRAAVAQSVREYESVRAEYDSISARVAEASADLDKVVAEQTQARDRLRARVTAIYRSGDTDYFLILLGSSDVQDFVTRWDILARLAVQDASTLRALKVARAEAERTAEELLSLQAEQARALDAVTANVESARGALAASEAALKEYEERIAAANAAAPAPTAAPASPKPSDPTQQLTGSGAWQTGVASHYGREFSGRGASGATIGPYSMIVAHKTLPFGTLIEFEYNGKRAVAKVVDRGPFTPGRDFDLGPGVVRVLDFSGVHEVRYRVIKR